MRLPFVTRREYDELKAAFEHLRRDMDTLALMNAELIQEAETILAMQQQPPPTFPLTFPALGRN